VPLVNRFVHLVDQTHQDLVLDIDFFDTDTQVI